MPIFVIFHFKHAWFDKGVTLSLPLQQTWPLHRQTPHAKDPRAVQQDRRGLADQTLDLHAGRRHGEAVGPHEPRDG